MFMSWAMGRLYVLWTRFGDASTETLPPSNPPPSRSGTTAGSGLDGSAATVADAGDRQLDERALRQLIVKAMVAGSLSGPRGRRGPTLGTGFGDRFGSSQGRSGCLKDE